MDDPHRIGTLCARSSCFSCAGQMPASAQLVLNMQRLELMPIFLVFIEKDGFSKQQRAYLAPLFYLGRKQE
jgi:hypothetical protein